MSSKIVKAREQFYAGTPLTAADTLAKIKDKKGKNRILALLEYGLAQHVAGNYQESANALLEADRVIEKEDVVHVAEETGSLITNEMVTTFKPEGFEWVMVHTYLSMNFMLMDDWSAARVEARKALNILNDLDPELWEQPFTRYICGLAYEIMDDLDDAYIEYKRVVQSVPGAFPIYQELHRIAILNGNGEDAQMWKEKAEDHGGKIEAESKPPNIIVFVGAGRSPIKKEINIVVPPHLNRFVVPDYKSSGSRAKAAQLKIGVQYTAHSSTLTDLDPLAEATLKGRMPKIIAKEVARVIAKEVIVKQIGDQNALLGLGARVAAFASEAADIRSWETLPRYLGVILHTVPPGTYDVTIEFYSKRGVMLGSVLREGVVIRDGRRTVLSVRSIR